MPLEIANRQSEIENPLNPHHVQTRTLIFGASGAGKTTLAAEIVRRAPHAVRLVWDAAGVFASLLDVPRSRTLAACAAALARDGLACFDFTGEVQDQQEGFRRFCDFAWAVGTRLHRPKLVVIDELQNFAPNSGKCLPSLLRLMDCGRMEEIDTLCLSNTPGIHARVRPQWTQAITFQWSDANDLDNLRTYGFPAAAVAALPRFAWLARIKHSPALYRSRN